MEVLPCVTHNNWGEMIGPCNACYMWALFRSTVSSDYMTWGDVISIQEEYLESLKSPEEKAADEVVKVKKDHTRILQVYEYKLNTYADRKGKVNEIDSPCKYFCHGGEYGVPTPANGPWKAGCQNPAKCPFRHPDHPRWSLAVEADKLRKAAGGGKPANSWRK